MSSIDDATNYISYGRHGTMLKWLHDLKEKIMVARIYSPTKTAMQSGKAKLGIWVLEFEPKNAKMVEPLMGYTSTTDMLSTVHLRFDTKEEAIAFANKKGIAYSIEEPNQETRRKISYSDNFSSNRQQAWTH